MEYLRAKRAPSVRDIYGEVNVKIHPQKFGKGARWAFEAKLPPKLAEFGGVEW